MESYDKIFLTGCDKNTEWMLPWFLTNYLNKNNTPIVVANFGMTNEGLENLKNFSIKEIIDVSHLKENGWFKKPKSMIEMSKRSNYVCWIDTDIEVLDDISNVFDYVLDNKLAMVEDKPWTKRRGETWHNSGVVAFKNSPTILHEWAKSIEKNPMTGDQEVLHSMMKDPLTRLRYINDIPNEYNWLRLQLLEGQDSKKKKVIHWTGTKGKQHIKSRIK